MDRLVCACFCTLTGQKCPDFVENIILTFHFEWKSNKLRVISDFSTVLYIWNIYGKNYYLYTVPSTIIGSPGKHEQNRLLKTLLTFFHFIQKNSQKCNIFEVQWQKIPYILSGNKYFFLKSMCTTITGTPSFSTSCSLSYWYRTLHYTNKSPWSRLLTLPLPACVNWSNSKLLWIRVS